MKFSVLDRLTDQRLLVPATAAGYAVLTAWVLVQKGLVPAALPLVLVFAMVAILTGLSRPQAVVLALIGVLTFFPIARVSLGGAPLYASDALVALGLVAMILHSDVGIGRFGRGVLLYLALWLPAWILQMVRLNLFLAPTYGLIRQGLAVLAFFLGLSIARHPQRRPTLILTMAAGMLVTEVLTIAQAFPGTAGVVRSTLLSTIPAFAGNGYMVYPDRAFALFTAPTTLSGFLAIMVLILIGCIPYVTGHRRAVVIAALVLSAPALLATYSRGWIAGMAIGLLILGVLNRGAFRRALILLTVVLGVVWATLSTGTLDAQYLQTRFGRLGTSDPNVQLRIERQQEYYSAVRADPVGSLVGQGFSGQDLLARHLVGAKEADQLSVGVSDNGYLLEAYAHGLMALLVLVGLLLIALRLGIRAARHRGHDREFLAGLSAALAATIVLHMEQYFYQAVFMRTFLWLVIGLVVGTVAVQSHADSRAG